MRLALPAATLAAFVGVGFGYAAFGTIVLLSNVVVAYRLWWLEVAAAVAAAAWAYALSGRVAARQDERPRVDRGERAIWHLAYRRGRVLTVDGIVRETMLDESSAVGALQALVAKGEAERLEDGSWRLLDGPSATTSRGAARR